MEMCIRDSYTVVSPHLVPGIHPAFIRHGSDLLLGVGAAQISRIIQVESPVGGHGKDLAVSRVHGEDVYKRQPPGRAPH